MISKRTKYGLKALAYLAANGDGRLVSVSEIAGKEIIPRKFLEFILVSLKNTGYLKSEKGKSGGYKLLKPAEKITLAEVYRILEGPIAMVPCVSLNFYEKCDDCPDEEKCIVHRLMLEVRDSTLKIMNNTTIADLINNPLSI